MAAIDGNRTTGLTRRGFVSLAGAAALAAAGTQAACSGDGAGEDAEEKHVGGTEADALHAQFSQGETRRADEADDDDGLYGRMLEYGF